MSADKSTPRPWKVISGNIWSEKEFVSCGVAKPVTADIGEANASLIVKAVNSYDALLEVAKKYLADQEQRKKNFGEGDWIFDSTIDQIRQAIAQAEAA